MRSPVTYVKQQHRFGCGPACLAMITGLPYEQVVSELGGDFTENHGMTFHDADSWLVEKGYATSRLWKFRRGNIPRDPWPPIPWADVSLFSSALPGGSHFLILLRNGDVIDPNRDDNPRKIEEYDVQNIAGVHQFQKGCAPR